jgi:hypothetical protein
MATKFLLVTARHGDWDRDHEYLPAATITAIDAAALIDQLKAQRDRRLKELENDYTDVCLYARDEDLEAEKREVEDEQYRVEYGFSDLVAALRTATVGQQTKLNMFPKNRETTAVALPDDWPMA